VPSVETSEKAILFTHTSEK